MEPELPGGDDGIPAADAGTGAPPPAEGFGVGGEEPSTPELSTPERSTGGTTDGAPSDTPFRTPDPTEVGPDVS